MKKFIPVGYRIKIECTRETLVLAPGEEVRGDEVFYKGTDIFVRKLDSNNEMRDSAIGRVIYIGEDCFDNKGSKWCKVGDIVLYKRHSGVTDDRENEGKVYRYLNDDDIFAVQIEE